MLLPDIEVAIASWRAPRPPCEPHHATAKRPRKSDDSAEPELSNVLREGGCSFCNVVVHSLHERMICVNKQMYIIPAHSTFLWSDISHLITHANMLPSYDTIVLDPPWPRFVWAFCCM